MPQTFECPTCERDDFDMRRAMRQHHTIVHDESLSIKEFECHNCSKLFETYECQVKSDNPHCSKKCRGNTESKVVTFNCDECGDEVARQRAHFEQADKNFCSDECKFKYSRDRTSVPCNYCGEILELTDSQIEHGENNYCSTSCRSKWYHGERHPRWNPDNSDWPTAEDRQWRRAIFERDKFTCQDCDDDTGGNLVAHHIKRRRNCTKFEKYAVWNGVTLCRGCHAERHKGENEYEMLKWIAEQ